MPLLSVMGNNLDAQRNYETEIKKLIEQKEAADENHEAEIRKLKEQIEATDVKYQKQSVDLREAGSTRQKLEKNQKRLEEELRKKDEEFRSQEKELKKTRSEYKQQSLELKKAREAKQELENDRRRLEVQLKNKNEEFGELIKTRSEYEQQLRKASRAKQELENQLKKKDKEFGIKKNELMKTIREYEHQSLELKKAKQECENDRKKLEDQLRKKDEMFRMQEEKLMKSRTEFEQQSAELRKASLDKQECKNEQRILENQLRKKDKEFKIQEKKLIKSKSEYEQQSVELREIGVAKDKWENDRRRLEDELKKKDEQIKTQEKELIKSRSEYEQQSAKLSEAGVVKQKLENNQSRLKDQLKEKDNELAMQEEKLKKTTRYCQYLFAILMDAQKSLAHGDIKLQKQKSSFDELHKLSIEGDNQDLDDLLAHSETKLQKQSKSYEEPLRVKGSTDGWIHLSIKLTFDSKNLINVNSKGLVSIIQCYQQQTDGAAMTVTRCLYGTLQSINVTPAAEILPHDISRQRKRSASTDKIQASPMKRYCHEQASFLSSHASQGYASAAISWKSGCKADDMDFAATKSVNPVSCIDSEISTEHHKISDVASSSTDVLTSLSNAEISKASDKSPKVSQIQCLVPNNSTITKLDLSKTKLKLTEMIEIAQKFCDNAELEELSICSQTGITYCSEAEFIIDVILSVNSSLSKLVINGANFRPRLLNRSKPLANNIDMNFSLQHFYIADEFPLYLSQSDIFKENFITCSDGSKKIIKVDEECPFDHAAIFTHYVDCEGGVYYYKDHDVALFIPPGAILQNECVEIKVSSSFYDQFCMPQNHERISSYVWVGASYHFKLPVYLVINHFVDTKSVKNIKALTALEFKLCSSRREVMMTSYFDNDLRYCVISTDHFCTYCLTDSESQSSSSSKESNNHRVFLASYYSYKEKGPNNVFPYIAEICCSYFNKNCHKKVKEQFKGKKLIHSKDFVMQSGQHLTLEYEEVKPDSDWSVTLNQKKIDYDEFDFQQVEFEILKLKEEQHTYPPRFKLWFIQTKKNSNASISRSLTLKLTGTKEICSFPFTTGLGNISQLTNVSTEGSPSHSSETKIDVMNIKPEMWDLIKIVFPKIKAKWQFVAYVMKYTPLEVKAFKNDSNDLDENCLNLFTDWLNTNHGITPKTWQILIDQIKTVDGLQNAAENIEEKVKTLNM